MVSKEVFERIYKIKYKNSTATCFVISYDGREYLATAKHLIPDVINMHEYELEISVANKYKKILSRVYIHANSLIDIAIIDYEFPNKKVNHISGPDSDKIFVGEEVYFAGFPYGLSTNVEGNPLIFNLPLIKKACLSGLASDTHNGRIYYLDGHNNPGFSGGPVFKYTDDYKNIALLAIISSYRINETKVLDEKYNETPYLIRENSGIIISYCFTHALEILNQIQYN